MKPSEMSNEELVAMVRDWASSHMTVTEDYVMDEFDEIAARLRNSIPKPVVEVCDCPQYNQWFDRWPPKVVVEGRTFMGVIQNDRGRYMAYPLRYIDGDFVIDKSMPMRANPCPKSYARSDMGAPWMVVHRQDCKTALGINDTEGGS